MAKVINQKEENVWALISSQYSPGEKKREEEANTKHLSVLRSIQGSDLRETLFHLTSGFVAIGTWLGWSMKDNTCLLRQELL